MTKPPTASATGSAGLDLPATARPVQLRQRFGFPWLSPILSEFAQYDYSTQTVNIRESPDQTSLKTIFNIRSGRRASEPPAEWEANNRSDEAARRRTRDLWEGIG